MAFLDLDLNTQLDPKSHCRVCQSLLRLYWGHCLRNGAHGSSKIWPSSSLNRCCKQRWAVVNNDIISSCKVELHLKTKKKRVKEEKLSYPKTEMTSKRHKNRRGKKDPANPCWILFFLLKKTVIWWPSSSCIIGSKTLWRETKICSKLNFRTNNPKAPTICLRLWSSLALSSFSTSACFYSFGPTKMIKVTHQAHKWYTLLFPIMFSDLSVWRLLSYWCNSCW